MPILSKRKQWQPRGVFDPQPASGDAAETTAFLARTSGLDATHTNAYKALINGLVSDSLFSLFDVLYIYATQDSTTALLNLISVTYSGTNANSLTFTADRGYTGDGTSAHYINLGINPSTATTPQFTQNSAHISAWNLVNAAAAQVLFSDSTASGGTNIYPRYSNDNIYVRLNESPAGNVSTTTDARGCYLASREASNSQIAYKNGVSLGSTSNASQAVANASLTALGESSSGSNWQAAMSSAGAALNATQQLNFYNRLRTYMTAVGVP
jgi:hypothetical protein